MTRTWEKKKITMHGYAKQTNQKKSVRVYGRGLNISNKKSIILCGTLTGKQLNKGRKLLKNLLGQTQDLDGKYYTKTAKEFLMLLDSAAKNAEARGLDEDRLLIHASAHKAFTFMRPRGWKHRRERKKMTNVQIVLEER